MPVSSILSSELDGDRNLAVFGLEAHEFSRFLHNIPQSSKAKQLDWTKLRGTSCPGFWGQQPMLASYHSIIIIILDQILMIVGIHLGEAPVILAFRCDMLQYCSLIYAGQVASKTACMFTLYCDSQARSNDIL